MTSIAIIGGTGYSGGNIAAEAARRGHEVTAVARHTATAPLPGVNYAVGAIDDPDFIAQLAGDHDVLVVAIHAVDGENQPVLLPLVPALADAAAAGGARLAFVGGAGSSLVAEGGPRLFDVEGFPAEYAPEARSHAAVLDWLYANAPEGLDWLYISPAAEYGGYNPGEATGSYRTGGDVLVSAEDGSSKISGADFALAFVDEIENRAFVNRRVTVGY